MNCIFINTKSCLIYCYQCDIEIVDRPITKTGKELIGRDKGKTSCADIKNESTYLDLRKLFAKQIVRISGSVVKEEEVCTELLKNDIFPLKTLFASMVNLYSIDYIRKLSKKRSLAHLYSANKYKIRLFRSGAANFFDGLFELGKQNSCSDVLEKFYFSLLKDESQLFQYQYTDFHVF